MWSKHTGISSESIFMKSNIDNSQTQSLLVYPFVLLSKHRDFSATCLWTVRPWWVLWTNMCFCVFLRCVLFRAVESLACTQHTSLSLPPSFPASNSNYLFLYFSTSSPISASTITNPHCWYSGGLPVLVLPRPDPLILSPVSVLSIWEK